MQKINREVIMLILTRKIGQNIHIGDDVIIEVLKVRGGTVSFGITAPRDLPIFRHEIYEQMKNQMNSRYLSKL
jgi:carbon storage regulator